MNKFDLAQIDIPEQRKALDRITVNAEALVIALRGREGQKLSRRELARQTVVVVEAQITLARGAREMLDMLEWARGAIEKQNGGSPPKAA